MITRARAVLARWIAPRPRLDGLPLLRALADRIEAGQLAEAERVEVAQLVLVTVAAVGLLEHRADDADPGGWALAVWEPIIDQVHNLDRVTARGAGS